MDQPITVAVALAVILALVVLILILKKRHEIAKHDNELIRQYNQQMDKIRTERLEEAQRKTRELLKKRTYYTTYNEIEPDAKVTMTKEKRDELAKYAKWRFAKNRHNKNK